MTDDRKWGERLVKRYLPAWATKHLDVEKVISHLEQERNLPNVLHWAPYVHCLLHLKAMKSSLGEDIPFQQRYLAGRQPGNTLEARYWVNRDYSLPSFPPLEMLWAVFIRGTKVRIAASCQLLLVPER